MSTPLLLLLESLLSRQGQQQALDQLAQLLDNTRESEYSVHDIIAQALDKFPSLAFTASKHDLSLPLHLAASLGDLQIVKLLMKASPTAATTPNNKGKIPLHFAAREGRFYIVQFFLQVNPSTAAIASNKGKHALHFAAGDGHYEICKILLQAYPQAASFPSLKGKLPLHFAARWGHLDIAKNLLIPEYPVQKLDYEGSTPLHDASREGQYEMSRYLIKLYPQALLTANIRGEIPLFPAVRSGNLSLVTLFVETCPSTSRYVLQNCSVEDHIENWGDGIVMLLLKGSMHASPTRIITMTSLSNNNNSQEKQQSHKNNKRKEASPTNKLDTNKPVSKKRRRVLENITTESHDSLDCQCYISTKAVTKRKFRPFHAVLECQAPIHVIKHVYKMCSGDCLEQVDEQGRYPLHLAVANATDNCDFILEELLQKFPQAALARDVHNRLPLHIAIACRAHERVVRALIKANPASAVEKCLTRDKWQNYTPLCMACECNLNLGGIYSLLRCDPCQKMIL